MKRQRQRLLGLAIVIPIIYAVSCGQGSQSKQAGANNKSDGRESSNPSVSATVSAQNNRGEDTQTVLRTNQAPATPSALDVPKASNETESDTQIDSFSAGVPPDPISLSQLPYYCDPRSYAPNVINSIAACNRFQPIPYIGFGANRYPPPLFPTGPIGYRIKRDVGRVDRDDDDDNHRRGWHNARK